MLLWPPLVLHVRPPSANVRAHHSLRSFTLALIRARSRSCLCGRTRLRLFVRAVVSLLVPATWSFSFGLCSCSLVVIRASLGSFRLCSCSFPLVRAHSVVLGELVPATWPCSFGLRLYSFGLVLALFVLVLAHSFVPTRLCSFELIPGTWSRSFGLRPCSFGLVWALMGLSLGSPASRMCLYQIYS